jgi:diguanylate cyclase (GGDEF)-like protein
MLEYLARLAATVANTSTAAIGLLSHGTEATLDLFGHGLLAEDPRPSLEIDAALAAGPMMSIIPDLATEHRVAHTGLAAAHPDLHFLCYRKLISAGGKHIGFICVLDQARRDCLAETEATSLDDLASAIIADRKKMQRHRHLMHVADRALRTDQMLRLVSESPTCSDALANLLRELCRFHGATTGIVAQLLQPDQDLRIFARYTATVSAEQEYRPVADTLPANPRLAMAIRRNEPHLVLRDDFATDHPIAPGLTAQICIPVSIHQRRFALLFGYETAGRNIELTMADMVALMEAIRPGLLRKITEERIHFVAHHDNLTQLANRLMFHQRLENTLSLARCEGQRFALLFLDLDRFKLVNDLLGHDTGDQLLMRVADRLRDNVRESDVIARMGGDEFAIIQTSGGQPLAAKALAQRLLQTMSQPFALNGRTALIGASIGIAFYPHDGENVETLLRNADIALYRAKAAGRNAYRMFSPDMAVGHNDTIGFEEELRSAIGGDQFALHYQPVCNISSLQIEGFEALLRWSHPLRGAISPDVFIPVAEASGSIVELGRWVLETACAQAAGWEPPVCLSVNLSPLQFRQPDLPMQIMTALERSGLAPDRLDLEITEGLLLDDSDHVLRTTELLQREGIGITLDDFGTAYASLSYLRRFRFDRIKIDRSFVQSIDQDDSALAIVEAILALGRRLDLTVVAEGVETQSQLDALRRLGCPLVQGYLSGRPMANEQARRLLLTEGFIDGGGHF